MEHTSVCVNITLQYCEMDHYWSLQGKAEAQQIKKYTPAYTNSPGHNPKSWLWDTYLGSYQTLSKNFYYDCILIKEKHLSLCYSSVENNSFFAIIKGL